MKKISRLIITILVGYSFVCLAPTSYAEQLSDQEKISVLQKVAGGLQHESDLAAAKELNLKIEEMIEIDNSEDSHEIYNAIMKSPGAAINIDTIITLFEAFPSLTIELTETAIDSKKPIDDSTIARWISMDEDYELTTKIFDLTMKAKLAKDQTIARFILATTNADLFASADGTPNRVAIFQEVQQIFNLALQENAVGPKTVAKYIEASYGINFEAAHDAFDLAIDRGITDANVFCYYIDSAINANNPAEAKRAYHLAEAADSAASTLNVAMASKFLDANACCVYIEAASESNNTSEVERIYRFAQNEGLTNEKVQCAYDKATKQVRLDRKRNASMFSELKQMLDHFNNDTDAHLSKRFAGMQVGSGD
jgi:hypothetical protein